MADSRSTPQALASTSTPIRIETSGSARSQPAARTARAATTTPSDPSRSARTWSSAARMLRLPPPGRQSTRAATRLTASPASPTPSTQPARISSGAARRRPASTKIQIASATSAAPLVKAARISARAKPKLRPSVGGRRASQAAPRARPSEPASAAMCTASARSAREPAIRPPAISTPANTSTSTRATVERRPLGLAARARARARDALCRPRLYSASSTLSIVTGVDGRSRPSRSTSEIRSTTSCPETTWPKTVCLPSSHEASAGRDDEELRAVRVGAGVRHRERAAHDLVLVELVLELIPRPAGAVAARATGLDHEVRDHAVEREPVVEALAGELREVLDGLRGLAGKELDLDRPFAGVERRVCHAVTVATAGGSRQLGTKTVNPASTSDRSGALRTLLR